MYHIKNERGVIAFVALALVVLLTTLGLVSLKTSNDEIKLAGNERSEMRAFYAAEAGLERAVSEIQAQYMKTSVPPSTMPTGSISLNDVTCGYASADKGPAELKDLTVGAFAGLYAQMKEFSMNSTGRDEFNGSMVTLSETFQVSLIPLFQFAIFYENNLELFPGPDMTLVGRVHTNSNMYIGADNKLNMDSYVTAGGSIYHGRHPASPVTLSSGSNEVYIKNTNGTYQNMYDGSAWLDAASPNWYDSSVSRWGGRVQDQAHGMKPLNLPLTNTAAGPHVMIERDGGGANPDSYENQAGLKILNQRVLNNVAGIWVDVTATATLEGWYSTTNNSFEDFREGKNVDVVEIDMSKFKSSSLFPKNGIVYFSDQDGSRDFPALQLKNGAEIGAPLTWASENPIYIEGNYNTVNKKPASVMGDAVTFLSNAWNGHKNQANLNNRVATATTANVSIVTGDFQTAGGQYSGGVQNLPRFLEKWTGVNFTWRGSMIEMWESKQANSPWGGGYYTPPNRDWAFDTDLDDPAKLPPGTPMARYFARVGWSQKDITYSAN